MKKISNIHVYPKKSLGGGRDRLLLTYKNMQGPALSTAFLDQSLVINCRRNVFSALGYDGGDTYISPIEAWIKKFVRVILLHGNNINASKPMQPSVFHPLPGGGSLYVLGLSLMRFYHGLYLKTKEKDHV